MDRLFGYRRKNSGGDLMNIETILGSVLQPVAPRQEFVHSLQARLMTTAFPEVEKAEKQAKKNIAVLVLSLMGVTVILGMWIRMIVTLLAVLGIGMNAKRGMRRRKVLTLQSSA